MSDTDDVFDDLCDDEDCDNPFDWTSEAGHLEVERWYGAAVLVLLAILWIGALVFG